ncbi:MAG: 4Fe-4S dicluster domain-containing protein, partial [Anaerolineales bacterium]|nr:4Fe-4S dicluster domain-containing protein [Anaerolineales bacterium]
ASSDIDRLNAALSEKWPRFPYRLDFDVSDLPSLMTMSMKSPLWEQLGERCLGCAACTNVCPTCFCFDVNDELDLNLTSGQRVRKWDSCQLDEFATVAGGHDFRKSRALRQRHRFMRKGRYILEAHHFLGCVGCGRCARACLVDITPVGVFNELYHERELGGRA